MRCVRPRLSQPTRAGIPRQRRRPRHALRPEPERPVRPHVHFADLADGAPHDVLDGAAFPVARVTLVAHLRDDALLLGRFLLQVPRFVNRPAERLLDVDVLAGIHRVRGNDGVHVIRRRDDDRVEVLLLLEHLAVVAVLRQARNLPLDEAAQVGGVVLRRPLRVGGELRLRRSPDLERAWRRCGWRRPLVPWSAAAAPPAPDASTARASRRAGRSRSRRSRRCSGSSRRGRFPPPCRGSRRRRR